MFYGPGHSSWTQLIALFQGHESPVPDHEILPLLALARQHKCIPHLYRCYQNQNRPNPQALKTFQHAYQPLQQQALKQVSDLIHLQKAFDAVGIRCIHLKGVTLAQQLYGNLAGKQSSDIDVLIAPNQIRQAHQVLIDMGYQQLSSLPVTEKELPYVERFIKDLEYKHPTRTKIELHWRFQNNPQFFPVLFESLWQSQETVTLAGKALVVLNPNNQLLYLTIHASTYCKRLTWLMDVSALIQQHQFDWHHLLQRSERLGFKRAFVACVLLACELQGLSCPTELESFYQGSRATRVIKHFLQSDLKGGAWSKIGWIRLWIFHLFNDQKTSFFVNYRTQFRCRYGRWYRWGLPRSLFWLTLLFEPFFILMASVRHTRSLGEYFFKRIRALCTR